MSIVPSIATLTSGYNLSKINSNFQNIKTALADALSRSGSSPNQMTADIDMNTNDVLNAGLITASNLTIGGVQLAPGTLAVGPQGVSGWSPVFAVVTDSARRVLQLVSYTGGGGTAPTTYINYYVGATGMTNVLANGVDIRGATGAGSGDMVKATYDAATVNEQLLGLTAVQTVTNKKLSDTTTKIVNASDNTKAALFDASSIKTGTTRTYGLQDQNGTIGLTDIQQGALFGCTTVYSSSTSYQVLSGVCRDSTNVRTMIVPTITKTTAAWVVGNGSGGLDTGTIGNNTYHVFAITRIDTGVVDVLFSLSATAPTLPTNYTLFRRVGSIIRTGGVLINVIQDGDYFYFNNGAQTAGGGGGGTLAYDYNAAGYHAKATLTVNTPSGIRVEGVFQCDISPPAILSMCAIFLYDGVNTSISKVFGSSGNYYSMGLVGTTTQWTNTSSQIQMAFLRDNGTASPGTARITTLGWRDTRGRI